MGDACACDSGPLQCFCTAVAASQSLLRSGRVRVLADPRTSAVSWAAPGGGPEVQLRRSGSWRAMWPHKDMRVLPVSRTLCCV